MGLRINTNIAALNTARILRRSTGALNRSLERLSSGLRINRAADDAAGLAIAEGFNSVVRGTRVVQRNAQDGISLVQTAEGALEVTTNILQRIRELAVQAANGTNSPGNRDDLNLEVQQLLLQINDIADNTEFNGVIPLDGSILAPGIVLQVGSEVNQTLTLTFTNARTDGPLSLVGVSVAGVDASAANDALTRVDAALTLVNTQRSAFGAFQNRLEFTISTLAIQEANSAASESAIRDADIALETIVFTRNQILVSAGTSILAQANMIPQTALQLLGG